MVKNSSGNANDVCIPPIRIYFITCVVILGRLKDDPGSRILPGYSLSSPYIVPEEWHLSTFLIRCSLRFMGHSLCQLLLHGVEYALQGFVVAVKLHGAFVERLA